MLTRRTFLSAIAVSPLLVNTGNSAEINGKNELTKFELLGVRDPQLGMQLALADYFKLFQAEGIDVTVRWQESSGDMLSIMGGGFPIGVGNPLSQIILASRNIPVKILCAFADISGGQGLVLAPGFHPASPADLVGKRCAFTEGTNNPLILSHLAEKYHFDVKKIRMMNMEPSEGVVAASRGDVDMLLSWQPFLYRLQQLNGTLYVTGNTLYFTQPPTKLSEREKLLYQHSTLIARQDWIKQYPRTTASLLRALINAENYFYAHKEESLAALESVLKVPAGALKVMVDNSVYKLSLSDALADTFRSTAQWALANKRISSLPDMSNAVAPGPLKGVAPARVQWSSSHA